MSVTAGLALALCALNALAAGPSPLERARALRRAGRLAQAAAVIDGAVAERGQDPELLTERALIYDQLGPPARAIEALNRALAAGSGKSEFLYTLLGQDYFATGQLEKGRRAFLESKRLGEAYIDMGYFELNQGLDDQARRDFQFAVARDTGDAEALQHLGSYYDNRGELAKAEECLRRALAMQDGRDSPERLHTLHWLGHVLAEEGKLGEAEAAFREGAAAPASHVWGRNLRGLHMASLASVLASEGKTEEARREFQAARDYCGKSCDPEFRCGVLDDAAAFYADHGEKDRALAAADLSLKLCPDLPEVELFVAKTIYSFHDLAGVYAELGRTAKAEAIYREILAQRGRVPYQYAVGRAAQGLAALRAAQGRRREAEKLYREAIGIWARHGLTKEEKSAEAGLEALYSKR